MKYIVFWVLAKLVSVPCSEPTPNEYGINGFTAYLGGCQKIERDTLQKEFDSRAAAQAFIEGSKNHQCDWPCDGIEKIWLDSASVEPEARGVTFRIADENVTTGSYFTSNPHIVTAELRPDLFREIQIQRDKPYYYSVSDSIAALQKQVAELRAVVEKLAIKPGASPNKNEHGKQ